MKKLAVVGTIFVILVISGIHSYALDNVIHGCYKKNEGQLRIVLKGTACRPSEVPISWNMVGPQGPAGPTGPQGPQGPAGPQSPLGNAGQIPRIYDAKEQFLGILPGDLDGFLSVFIPTLSRFIFISPESGDVDPFYPAVYVYFEDSKCLGNPYLDTNMRYLVFKLGPNYYKADEEVAQTKTINSISSPMWDGSRQCQTRSSINIPVLPATQVGLPFTLPVTLPLHFE